MAGTTKALTARSLATRGLVWAWSDNESEAASGVVRHGPEKRPAVVSMPQHGSRKWRQETAAGNRIASHHRKPGAFANPQANDRSDSASSHVGIPNDESLSMRLVPLDYLLPPLEELCSSSVNSRLGFTAGDHISDVWSGRRSTNNLGSNLPPLPLAECIGYELKRSQNSSYNAGTSQSYQVASSEMTASDGEDVINSPGESEAISRERTFHDSEYLPVSCDEDARIEAAADAAVERAMVERRLRRKKPSVRRVSVSEEQRRLRSQRMKDEERRTGCYSKRAAQLFADPERKARQLAAMQVCDMPYAMQPGSILTMRTSECMREIEGTGGVSKHGS